MDFERYYRPLPELMDSGRKPRYILALIAKLPAESATVAATRGGPQFLGWNLTLYYLAALIDAVNANTYVVTRANGGKPNKPEPTYTPDKPKTQNSFAAMARNFYNAAQST